MTLLGDVLKGTVQEAIAIQQQGGKDMLGIPSGLTKLDQLLGGFRQGEYYVVAGRPGSGKSALAFNFAMHASSLGHTSAYISFEMSRDVLALRYLAAVTGMSTHYIERGKFSNQEGTKLRQAAAATTQLALHIYDTSMVVARVADLLDYHLQQGDPIDILFVDYISLFSDASDNEQDRVSKISLKLREYSRDLNIPVVSLAQLNRNVEHRENKMPVLSDLRDSGQLEQDASGVIFTYRPHYYAMMEGKPAVPIENNAMLNVAKNRHGPTPLVPVSFQPKQMLWTDRQAGHEEDVAETKKGKKNA